jgi:hypothetical protein
MAGDHRKAGFRTLHFTKHDGHFPNYFEMRRQRRLQAGAKPGEHVFVETPLRAHKD